MMRKVVFTGCLFIFLLPLILTAQTDTAWSILALLNDERETLNIRPLAINPLLTEAAQRHSDDMASGEFLSHTGSDESEFWERIADTDYNMISGAENVLYRNDANPMGAFTQWSNSPDHYSNMVNPVYQEVGVAFAYSASGRVYFTMVLASRADFTTPTATPSAIPATATTAPLVSPTPQVNVTATVVQLTPVPTFTATPLQATSVPASPTVQPTETPEELIDAAILQQGITSILVGQVRVGQVLPTPIPSPTPLITETPLPTFDIRLEYSPESFTLMNISTVPQYVEGLYFESASGAMDASRWSTEFLTASLTSFPAQGCLQVWNVEITTPLDAPARCGARHAWIAVNDAGSFWRGASTFDVYRFGELVTTCTVSTTGACEFDLEDRAEVASPPANDVPNNNAVTAGASDLVLVYDIESFSVVNMSGADIDLSGLGFASASGVVNISEWDTQFLSRSLSAFPPNDCLQAWSILAEEWSERPAECNVRHAWIAVSESQMFWTNTDAFTVSRGGAVVATCYVSQGRCEVNLP